VHAVAAAVVNIILTFQIYLTLRKARKAKFVSKLQHTDNTLGMFYTYAYVL